jgi:hypothetical protein
VARNDWRAVSRRCGIRLLVEQHDQFVAEVLAQPLADLYGIEAALDQFALAARHLRHAEQAE